MFDGSENRFHPTSNLGENDDDNSDEGDDPVRRK